MVVRPVLRSLLVAALVAAPALASAQAVNQYPLTVASSASPCPAESCIEVPGFPNGVAVQVAEPGSAGTWTLQFEGTLTGASWVALTLTPPGSTTGVTSTTAAGVWRGAAGMRFRVRLSAWTSGAPRITILPLDTPPVAGGGGSGGAGTEYAEGATAATITGTAFMWEDTGDTLRSVSAAKPLPVAIISGAGSGGTALADRSGTFTPNVTSFTPIGGFMDETSPDVCTEGAPCAFRMTAARQLRVDGTGGSFPVTDSGGSLTVDGTVTVTATNLDVQIGGSDSLTIGTFPDNEPFNIAQMNGVTVLMGNGATGTGSQRVTLANDNTIPTGWPTAANQSTEITALQLIDNLPNTLGSTTAGQSGALALGAVTTAAPSYTTAQTNALSLTLTGGLRTTLFSAAGAELTPSQDATFGTTTFTEATSTGPTAGAVRNDTLDSLVNTTNEMGPLALTSTGALWVAQPDPCSFTAKTFLPFNITSATTTEITPSLAGASTNYYVCSLVMVTGVANNVALADDDTDNCASVTSGMAGGTTAANGFNFAANGGLVAVGGNATIAKTNGTNRVVCLVTSSAGPLSGTMGIVAAP